MRKRLSAATAACLVALVPANAAAHSPIPGIEGFYVGLLHPFSTAPQILGLLSLGVMLGLLFPRHMPLAWGTFALAVLGGIAVGAAGATPLYGDGVLLATAVIGSVSAALVPNSHGALRLAVCVGCGAGLGIASMPDPGPMRATIITLSGSVVGMNIAVLYLAGGLGWLREKVRAPVGTLGLRVLAAWIAAVALLMGALEFAPVDSALAR